MTKVTRVEYNRETDGPFLGGNGLLIPFAPRKTSPSKEPLESNQATPQTKVLKADY